MADLHVDDAKLQELLTKAVSQMLSDKRADLDRATLHFLDDAERAQRDILNSFDASKDRFESRAREKLADADTQIRTFTDALSEKKKKVEDALNLRIIAGFSAALLVAALVVISFLTERVITVNEKAKELTKSAGELKTSIDNASEIYKRIGDSAKGADFSSQLQTLTILTTRMNDDVQRLDAQINALRTDIRPLQRDYDVRHPKGK